MAKHQTQILCTSVFKSGESTPAKSQFTERWIALVHLLEKSKRNVTARR